MRWTETVRLYWTIVGLALFGMGIALTGDAEGFRQTLLGFSMGVGAAMTAYGLLTPPDKPE